jgi:hypothetical protein
MDSGPRSESAFTRVFDALCARVRNDGGEMVPIDRNSVTVRIVSVAIVHSAAN